MKELFRAKKRFLCILTPAIIGLVYMLLCFAGIRRSIWFDESYSAYLTRFSFKDIWSLTAVDVHPPLYYYLLKTWAHFFGHTDFAMRSMSTIFGALAILFLFLWLKYKYGFKAAFTGSFFAAISPVFVRYGQEMRMYTFIFFLVCASTYFLQLAIDTEQKRWWIIYAVLVALGMWTHYFSAFAWVAQLIYLISIYGKKIFQKKIIATYILAVALFLPWAPSLLSQVGTVEGNGFWIAEPSIKTLADYFSEILLYARSEEVKNWLLLLGIAAISTILFLIVKNFKKAKFLCISAFVPVILLTLLSMPPMRSMFVSRYVMYSMVFVWVLAGVSLVIYSRKKPSKKTPKLLRPAISATFMAIVLLATSVFGLKSVFDKGNYNFNTDIQPSVKQLYETIVGLDYGENLPIISASTWLYYDLSFYTTSEHSVYFIDEISEYPYGSLLPLQQSDVGKIDDLDAFLENHDRVWFVGEKGEEGIKFPRKEWKEVLSSDLNLHEKSPTYQVILLEKK